MRVRKAIIPAAGLGTRFLPATKAQPKEMLPIVDTPIIQYVVEEAVAAGIEDLIFITGRTKRAIEDHFDRSVELETFLEQGQKTDLLNSIRDIANLVDIHYIRQKEPLGLGHAVGLAKRHIGNEPFAVLLGDEVFVGEPNCLQQLVGQYEKLSAPVVAVREVLFEHVHRYGIVDAKPVAPSLFRIEDLIEKPSQELAPSNLAVVGRYVLTPNVLDILETLPPGKNGEIQLTDALRILARQFPIFAYVDNTQRYDVGDKLGYLQATVEFALRRPELGEAFLSYLEHVVRITRSRD